MAIVTLVASKATPHEAIKYITNPQKAALIDGRNLDANEDFAKQMRRTAKLWGKAQGRDDRKYYHLKISFAKEDWDRNGGTLSEEKALQIGKKILKEFFGSKEGLLAAHNDTNVLHVHGIINAVDLIDGKMLDMRDSEYRKLKDRVQEICRENGLKDLDWREATKKKREKEQQNEEPIRETFAEKGLKERGKTPWKETLRNVIDNALQSCCSMEEFRTFLYTKGIELTRCTDKTISYKLGEHKACRGDSLGGDYTAEAIRDALEQNRALRVASPERKTEGMELEQLIGAAGDYESNVTPQERATFREWGRTVGFRRSEVDALCKYRSPACSWEEKKRAWDAYKLAKDEFWAEYSKRSQSLRDAVSDAYKRRQRVRNAEWAIDPRNTRKTLFGVLYAAIVFARNDHRVTIEREIAYLKQQQQELKLSISAFKNTTEAALEVLRKKDLPLDEYLASVERLQNIADSLQRAAERDKDRKNKDFLL